MVCYGFQSGKRLTGTEHFSFGFADSCLLVCTLQMRKTDNVDDWVDAYFANDPYYPRPNHEGELYPQYKQFYSGYRQGYAQVSNKGCVKLGTKAD